MLGGGGLSQTHRAGPSDLSSPHLRGAGVGGSQEASPRAQHPRKRRPREGSFWPKVTPQIAGGSFYHFSRWLKPGFLVYFKPVFVMAENRSPEPGGDDADVDNGEVSEERG